MMVKLYKTILNVYSIPTADWQFRNNMKKLITVSDVKKPAT